MKSSSESWVILYDNKSYVWKIFTENSGYWAECQCINGLKTQARNKVELKKNIRTVLGLYLGK